MLEIFRPVKGQLFIYDFIPIIAHRSFASGPSAGICAYEEQRAIEVSTVPPTKKIQELYTNCMNIYIKTYILWLSEIVMETIRG